MNPQAGKPRFFHPLSRWSGAGGAASCLEPLTGKQDRATQPHYMSTTPALETPPARAAHTELPTTIAPIVCDPSWSLEQSMRFIIARLAPYRPTSKLDTLGRRGPEVAARIAKAMEMRYGLGGGSRAASGYGIGMREIAAALGITSTALGVDVLMFLEVARAATIDAPAFAALHESARNAERPARPDQTDLERFASEVLSGVRVARRGRPRRDPVVTALVRLEPVVCDPSLNVAQSIRFIIDAVAPFSVRPDGSVTRALEAPGGVERVARVGRLHFGVDEEHAGALSTREISEALAVPTRDVGRSLHTVAAVAKSAGVVAPAIERLARAGGNEVARTIKDEGLSLEAVERFVIQVLGQSASIRRRIECDASWTVAQSMRFIIGKVSLYRACPDGTLKVSLPDAAERVEQTALMRYGVHEGRAGAVPGRATGEDIGSDLGVSRQRARQYVEKFIEAARCFEIVAPAFETLARTGAPFYPSRAAEMHAQEIRGEGLVQRDAAFFMAEVLGRPTAGEEVQSLARDIEQRRVDVVAAAHSMVSWAGAAYMPAILQKAGDRGASPAEVDGLRDLLCSGPGFEYLGRAQAGWFWFGDTEPEANLVIRVVRQLLSVARLPVPLACLEDALARAWRLRDAYRPKPRLEVPLPQVVIDQIVRRLADVDIHDGAMTSRVALSPNEELPDFEFGIYEAAMRHGGVLSTAQVMAAARLPASYLARFHLWVRTTCLFERLGRGLYALKYSPTDARAIENLSVLRRTRRARPWENAPVAQAGATFKFSLNLTAVAMRKPVLFLPAALELLSPLGKWEVPALGITIECSLRSTGHFAFVGFVRWLEAAGYRAGDVVHLELDPASRTVALTGRPFNEATLAAARASGRLPRRSANSKDAVVLADGSIVSFMVKLTGHAVDRKYIRVPTAVMASLPVGKYQVRGHAYTAEVVPRTTENPSINGLVPFLLDKGLRVNGAVRVSFDLAARDVDVAFPEGE